MALSNIQLSERESILNMSKALDSTANTLGVGENWPLQSKVLEVSKSAIGL